MTLTIQAGKYYRTRDGRKVGPMKPNASSDYPFRTDFGETYTALGTIFHSNHNQGDLISEWQDETPAHIIQSSNGRVYDLTALEAPFGLLPEDVQNALKDWPHGCEIWLDYGWSDINPSWSTGCVYRAKPAPEVKEYVLYWLPGYSASEVQILEDTHRITIRDDGTGKLTAEVEALQ